MRRALNGSGRYSRMALNATPVIVTPGTLREAATRSGPTRCTNHNELQNYTSINLGKHLLRLWRTFCAGYALSSNSNTNFRAARYRFNSLGRIHQRYAQASLTINTGKIRSLQQILL